ncbi:MAG: potassium channel protein [Bdellovibrionaceae bacterium]|nr:potassium channel protein [Bdellovibrionales bacterium]MCB9083756.1 potassium channel protein [Pseudobdellovibrionaceae bacterium]
MVSIRRSTFFVAILVVLVFVGGVFGYSYIEGWGLFDSLYMTAITLTTTGYQEVRPLSPEGRAFTIVLLIVGMGTVAFSITQFMQDLFSINFKLQRRKKMEKKLEGLVGHTIICGYGRIGRVIASELHRAERDFAIIEKNERNLHDLEQTPYLFVEGDATHDEYLERAGIRRAACLVNMVDCDADSLYISLAGRTLNPDLYIIARASDESARRKILRAGADKVILPVVVSGVKVAQSVLNPAIEGLLDIEGVDLQADRRVQMAEIDITAKSKLKGKSLINCGFKREGVIVVGIRHKDGEFTFAPDSQYEFSEGDTLVTLSTPQSFEEVKQAQQDA